MKKKEYKFIEHEFAFLAGAIEFARTVKTMKASDFSDYGDDSNIFPIFNTEGKVTGYTVFEDVTEKGKPN